MSTHTPGPWTIRITESGAIYVTGLILPGHRDDVAFVAPFGKWRETNARLIASAPELLAALKELLEAMWSETNFSGLHGKEINLSDALKNACAAIAKAEGTR